MPWILYCEMCEYCVVCFIIDLQKSVGSVSKERYGMSEPYPLLYQSNFQRYHSPNITIHGQKASSTKRLPPSPPHAKRIHRHLHICRWRSRPSILQKGWFEHWRIGTLWDFGCCVVVVAAAPAGVGSRCITLGGSELLFIASLYA